MSKRLFESSTPRHSIEIDRKGRNRKIQDTPKESFILCKACEKRLEILETLFSKKINTINNYINLKDRFQIAQFGNNKILKCININPIGFKLFIYSLVWRVSISNLKQFENFKLDNATESELRKILDQKLKSCHKGLLKSISVKENILNFDYCVFKPLTRNQDTRGIFTSYKMDKSQFAIFTVDFIIFFFSNSEKIDPAYKFISNKQNEKVLITLASTDNWKQLNKLVIQKMLKKL